MSRRRGHDSRSCASPTSVGPRLFGSDDQLRDLVAAFEACDLDPADFDHHRHMAVACWYLAHSEPDEALRRMRDGLHALLGSGGRSDAEIAGVYHETITAFWIRLLAYLLSLSDSEVPLYRRVEAILEHWGDSDPLETHYRRATLMSDAARRGWVEPDLEPLPG